LAKEFEIKPARNYDLPEEGQELRPKHVGAITNQ